MGKLPTQEGRDQVIAHIGRAFDNRSASAAHIGMFEQRWAPEQWSQGFRPVMGPGLLGEFGHAWRAPFERIHAGTETAYGVWLMTIVNRK
jgi:monoamine oxidase